MSTYSEISKRIGWEGHCAIPSIETATDLKKAVVSDKSTNGFELVFKIHRFAPSPTNEQELKAMNIINEAYCAGIVYFKLR